MSKPQAIGLIRLSSEESPKEGRAGFLRQKRDIENAARTHNIDVVRTVEMIDVSGTLVMHDARFQQMLSDLAKPGIAGVVTSAVDRVVRPGELGDLQVFDHFQRTRKLIYTPAQVIDMSTDAGFLTSGIYGVIAGIERRMIVARTNAGKEELRKRGHQPNSANTLPRGVAYIVPRDANGNKIGVGTWSYVEPWCSYVRQAYDMLFQGRSYYEIAERLNGTWNAGSIRDLLANPLWKGVRVWTWKAAGERKLSKDTGKPWRTLVRRDEPIEVQVIDPPLITPERWQAAQALLTERSHTWTKRTKHPERFLAAGLLECACGQAYYMLHSTRESRYDYYRCGSRQNRGFKCGAPVLRRLDVDAAVEQLVTRYLLDKDFLGAVLNTVEARQPETNTLKPATTSRAGREAQPSDRSVCGWIDREGRIRAASGSDRG